MITLGVDSTNSIHLNNLYSLVILSGKEALAQTLGQISKSQLGEMPYNQQEGIPYMDTVFQQRDFILFETAMRAAFLNHPEVNYVISFDMSQDGDQFNYTAQVDSIYGTITVNG